MGPITEAILPPSWLPDLPHSGEPGGTEQACELLRELGASPGRHPRERMTGWLGEVCVKLTEEALAAARELSAGELLRGLVQANEAVRIQQAAIYASAPGEVLDPTVTTMARDQVPLAATLSASLDFAVEMHSARPPTGDRRPSPRQLAELWNYAYSTLQMGVMSDLVHRGLVPSELTEDTSDRLKLPENDHLSERYLRSSTAVVIEKQDPVHPAPHLALNEREYLSTPEDSRHDELQLRLDAACFEHFEMDIETLSELIVTLALEAGFQVFGSEPGVQFGRYRATSEAELIISLSKQLSVRAAVVGRALQFLSIGPDPSFPNRESMVWVGGRKRSYQIRPLVRHPDGETLSWSGLHTFNARRMIISLLSRGALPGVPEDSELYSAMRAFSGWRGTVFEARVLSVVSADSRLRAKHVAKLDGLPIRKPNGDPLGDIDVLAAEPASRTLVVFEAKAATPGANPREIHNEIERFTATGEDRTDMDHHLMRVAFVEQHKDAALRTLGLPDQDTVGWRVRSAVVTLHSSMTDEQTNPVPIISLQQLSALDLVEWTQGLD